MRTPVRAEGHEGLGLVLAVTPERREDRRRRPELNPSRSVESPKPLRSFDLGGFSFPVEMGPRHPKGPQHPPPGLTAWVPPPKLLVFLPSPLTQA
jgi:hypothetical protein